MRKKLLSFIIFSLIMMVAVCGFAQTFNSSDLEGTWYVYSSRTNILAETSWAYGTFTFNNSGEITDGSYTTPSGYTVPAPVGQMSVDSDGIMNGTFIGEGGGTRTFHSGKLDQSKTIGSFVNFEGMVTADLGVMIKAGGSFLTSDLEGTWYLYSLETSWLGDTSWAYGTFTFNNSGEITDGSYTTPDGTTVSVTGGQMSVDSNGIITGSITEGVLTRTFPSGKLDQSKTIASFVNYSAYFTHDLGVMIKAGGSFLTSDLEGTWYVYLSETNLAGHTYWLYGTFTVNNSGEITGGSYTTPGGTTVSVTGGQMSVDNDGIINGTITAEGDVTGTFHSGKLDQSKTVASFVGTDIAGFVGTDTNDSLDLGVAIKLVAEQTEGGGTDGDGLPDGEEQGPNGNNQNYDGNSDGTADYLQDNVASFHTFDQKNYITLESPAGTSISNCNAVSNPSSTDAPSDVEFPYGFFKFTIDGLGIGSATTVTLHLPVGETIDTYYKFGSTPNNTTNHWYEFIYMFPYGDQMGAEINGNVITLHFMDGMRGDDDLTANGIVVDVGAPAKLVETSGEGDGSTLVASDGGGDGNCFIATAAYGSLMEPHVKILRDFRDKCLLDNALGKGFVKAYYRYSPPIADFISKHDNLRAVVRLSLLPIVGISWIALKIGSVLTVALMLFFISCFIVIVWFRRRHNE